MNEFIVYSESLEEFSRHVDLNKDNCIRFKNEYWNDMNLLCNKHNTIHNYIGIKDINNNKIYADSSIVEFEISIIESPTPQSTKHTGIIVYSSKELGYIFIEITDSGEIKNRGRFPIMYIVNKCEIIDTIQENKLGLFDKKED